MVKVTAYLLNPFRQDLFKRFQLKKLDATKPKITGLRRAKHDMPASYRQRKVEQTSV